MGSLLPFYTSLFSQHKKSYNSPELCAMDIPALLNFIFRNEPEKYSKCVTKHVIAIHADIIVDDSDDANSTASDNSEYFETSDSSDSGFQYSSYCTDLIPIQKSREEVCVLIDPYQFNYGLEAVDDVNDSIDLYAVAHRTGSNYNDRKFKVLRMVTCSDETFIACPDAKFEFLQNLVLGIDINQFYSASSCFRHCKFRCLKKAVFILFDKSNRPSVTKTVVGKQCTALVPTTQTLQKLRKRETHKYCIEMDLNAPRLESLEICGRLTTDLKTDELRVNVFFKSSNLPKLTSLKLTSVQTYIHWLFDFKKLKNLELHDVLDLTRPTVINIVAMLDLLCFKILFSKNLVKDLSTMMIILPNAGDLKDFECRHTTEEEEKNTAYDQYFSRDFSEDL